MHVVCPGCIPGYAALLLVLPAMTQGVGVVACSCKKAVEAEGLADLWSQKLNKCKAFCKLCLII